MSHPVRHALPPPTPTVICSPIIVVLLWDPSTPTPLSLTVRYGYLTLFPSPISPAGKGFFPGPFASDATP